MSKYLIDTNIIVDFWRGKLQVNDVNILKRASVSVITLCELFYGAERSTHIVKNKKLIEEFLSDFEIEVIDIETPASEIYGVIRTSLEKDGERVEDLDLLIASTAILNNKVLVTGNIKHFQRIKGLKLWIK